MKGITDMDTDNLIITGDSSEKRHKITMPEYLTVSSSPHVRASSTTQSVMLTVLIALLPALVWGIYIYGLRPLAVTLLSVLTCVVSEFLYEKLMKKRITVGDLSAAVTGVIFAFNLPPAVPYYLVVVGGVFAIVVVKQLFGGIGKNFLNPALAARVFLFMAWPKPMATYVAPGWVPIFAKQSDIVASATPLSSLKSGNISDVNLDIVQVFIGDKAGCIGEISCMLLLVGGLLMLFRRVITWHIPVSFIGTVAFLTYAFAPQSADAVSFMIYSVLSGGLFLGAWFMATDYVTCPINPTGRIIYGIGCGAITVFIRFFAGFNEGVSFAILVMNLLVWYIDKLTRPRPFGKMKAEKTADGGKK